MTYREALKARIAAASSAEKWRTSGPGEMEDGGSCAFGPIHTSEDGTDFDDACADADFMRTARTDVELLLAQLERAEAALGDLLGSGLDVNGGRNLGKSWSEYQVEDGAVNDAHEALASLRAVLDAEEK